MRRLRGDDGTILVLTLGFAGIIVVVVGIVVNVSAVVLAKRGVASAADGAAVSAAQALDTSVLYTEGLGTALPLDPGQAQQRVAAYEVEARASQPGLELAVQVDGRTAVVRAVRVVTLPFRLPGTGPVSVESVARARAPVVP